MIIPILSTGERDGKNRRVFGPKINETFLTLEGRIISTVFVIYSSQHVTGKQQYQRFFNWWDNKDYRLSRINQRRFFFMRYDCVITRYFDI